MNGGLEERRGRGFLPWLWFSLFFGQARGQPCEGEEDKNLIRMGGWRLRVKRREKKCSAPRVFCCPYNCKIAPPSCLSCGPVFIGKMLHGSPNWSLNFLSFFVNLIFLNFFVFFENEQYQRRLNEENQ